MAVLPLGIQDRNRLGQGFFRKVMVADDHVYALAGGVCDLVDGLDAAVQGYDEPGAVVRGPVYSLEGDAVTFVVPVRDVEVDLRGEAADERIHQCHGGCPVNVVIAVYEDFLPRGDGLMQPFHRLVHVLHQERVVQVLESWTEEGAGLVKGLHTAFYQKLGQDPVYSEFRAKAADLLRVRRLLQYPFPFHSHITQI